jgi:flavin reductase (DIM6/NTAB) family NADH-FMN oxidoreductase RutF
MNMFIPLSSKSKAEVYQLLVQTVLPRPIAYITTHNKNGLVNGAPFSFFNVVCSSPPIISVAIGKKRDGERKDTAKNIIENKEFIIHIVDSNNVQQVNDSAASYPSTISEIDKVGFTLTKSELVSVPRINESKIALECRLYEHLTVGESVDEPGTNLILGEVVGLHIDDQLYKEGEISTSLLKPIGRLGGTEYSEIASSFSIPRPKK